MPKSSAYAGPVRKGTEGYTTGKRPVPARGNAFNKGANRPAAFAHGKKKPADGMPGKGWPDNSYKDTSGSNRSGLKNP